MNFHDTYVIRRTLIKLKEETILDRSVELQKMNSLKNQFNEQIQAQTQTIAQAHAQIEEYQAQMSELSKNLANLESSNNQLR